MSDPQVFLVRTPTISYDLDGILPFTDIRTEDNCIYNEVALSINYVPIDTLSEVLFIINNDQNSSDY
jgi:hypothetical protein